MSRADPLGPLLAAGVEGDDRAITELVRRTQPAVRRLCVVLGSPADAEDLVQDVYLRALRAAPHFRGESPVLPWLLAIARNACADAVRRRQRQRRLHGRLRETAADTATIHGAPIGDLLDDIENERRDAFVLTQLAGLSYDDAAMVLGCPVGTVRSRVARARAELLQAVRRADAV